MKSPKRRHNPKRRFREDVSAVELERVRASMGYGGNPEHKRNPGDFNLTPPAQPRPDKTLCDEVGIFERKVALARLREGVARGLVSQSWTGPWPQNIWALTDADHVVEAQLENSELGTYHAYPLPESDPFAAAVRARWERADV